MEGTYDPRHNSAYLFFSPRAPERKVARTEEKENGVLYDYDREDKLIGIEFLNASRIFQESFLKQLTEK